MSETLPPLYFALLLPAGFFGGLTVHYMWTLHQALHSKEFFESCRNCLFWTSQHTCTKGLNCKGWELTE